MPYGERSSRQRPAFIDETWAKTNMAPLRGWAPVGQRLHAKVPYGHWRIMTFLAALRCDRIDAPCLLDQPVNGELHRVCRTVPRADALARRRRHHGQSEQPQTAR